MSEWISVKDRLPEIAPKKACSRSVLATDGKTVFVRQFFVGINGWGMKRVTYWMPKPAPPTEAKLERKEA